MAQQYSMDEVNALVEQLAPAFGVDPRTAKVIIGAEQVHRDPKTGNWIFPKAYSDAASPVGASGVGQVMPKTRAALLQQGHLPQQYANDTGLTGQVAASLAAIKEMLPRTGNDPLRIAAAYNGGNRAGQLYGTPEFSKAPAETQNHVLKAKFAMDNLNPDTASGDEARLARNNTPSAASTWSTNPLAALQAAFSGISSSGQAVLDSLTNSQATTASSKSTAADAARQIAQGANEQAAGVVQAAELKQQRQNALANIFSLTDADIEKNRQEYALTEARRVALEDDINQRMAVSIFDNPLAYVVNLTRLPGMVAEHNALARKTEQLDETVRDRQQLMSNQMGLTAADTTAAIKRQEAGRAMETAAKANAEVAKLVSETAATDAKNKIAAVQIKTQNFDTGVRLMDLIRREADQNIETAKLIKTEKESVVEHTALNTMLAPIGGAVDKKSWDGMTAKEKLPLRQMVGRTSYGNTLAESYDTIVGSGLYNKSKADPAIALTIDSIQSELNLRVQKANAKIKSGADAKPEAIRQQALRELEADWKTGADAKADRERLPRGNPYQVDFNSLYLNGKIGSKLVQDTIAKRIATDPVAGANSVTFDDISRDAVAKIIAGKTTPAAAAQEISAFYRTADAANYAARGLGLFGMPMPASYTVYAGLRKTPVDLNNAAQVETYLALQQIGIIRGAAIQQQMNADWNMGN